MTAQEGLEHKVQAAHPGKETRVALEKARAEAKTVLARARVEERARLKTGEALAEPQGTLAAAEAEVEQERQTRAEAEKALAVAQVESVLAEAKKVMKVEAEKIEPSPSAPGEGGAEQRVSFVVRLTVDEMGQPRRTEIKHAQSGKKETFPALDAQRLATFMKACLNPAVTPEPSTLSVPPSSSLEVPVLSLSRPISDLSVSDIEAFHKETPGVAALVFDLNETFVVQARFQFQGSAAFSLTAQKSSYEVHVYAHEMISGISRLLAIYRANLAKEVLEYSASMQVPGLSPGLYRLVTLVTLREPAKMIGHYE
jgi:hypothetical protein